jgi:succinoglycan biosynthesis protein ExoV
VIRRIAGADSVIAESMHAVIIADTFGVPWQAVSISGGFNQFKWQDWGQSLSMQVSIRPFFPMLRKLQSAGGRVIGSNAAVQPDGSAESRGPRGARQNAKQALLSARARASLKKAAKGRFTLSDRAALEQKKRDLWRVLAEVTKDYGGSH